MKMKKTEVAMIYSYFINLRNRLENEVSQLQSNLRYRRVDTVDCIELSTAIERLNMFREISSDIVLILQLEKDKNINKLDEFLKE